MAEDGYEQALLEHVSMLHNLTRRLTDNSHDAEDLAQETILAARQGWQRRGAPSRFGPWLATICLNLARSAYRRRRVRPAEHLNASAGEDHLASTRSVDLEAVARVEAAAVHAEIAALPHHQRESIVLMDLCGFTAAETGEILSVPRNTVLSRVHRGHKTLALRLLAWAPDPWKGEPMVLTTLTTRTSKTPISTMPSIR